MMLVSTGTRFMGMALAIEVPDTMSVEERKRVLSYFEKHLAELARPFKPQFCMRCDWPQPMPQRESAPDVQIP